MTTKNIILTVVAPDRFGIVQQLADVIRKQGGNWLESNLSRLGGQFAGAISISIARANLEQLQTALYALADKEIRVGVHELLSEVSAEAVKVPANLLEIDIKANDRPGIIEDISVVLAENNMNVENMTTSCESASMAGYDLFKARIKVALPANMTTDHLEAVLENVSDDVMVVVLPLSVDNTLVGAA